MFFKYVALHYVKHMLIILLGLTGLFAGLDYLMNGSSLNSFNIKILYAFSKWQEALNLLYPLAIIFGAIWTYISFVKNHTLSSFYALGVTRKELLRPFLLIATITYLFFLGLNFTSFATANDTAKKVKKNQYGVSKTEDLFFKYDDSFVYIGALIPQRYKIEDLTIFKMKNNEVTETFTAKEAWYNIHEWVAFDVTKKSKQVDKNGSEYLKIEKIVRLHTLKDYQPKILTSIYNGKELTLDAAIAAKKLLANQGLSTEALRADIYGKIVLPLFAIALMIILILSFPFHARYMNITATTMKALGGTLFIWGILFALQRIGENGTVMPEVAIILPIILLFVYALYTFKEADNQI
jgi:lipopolysaccharide export system permease protein